MLYKPVASKPAFVELETQVLRFWQENKSFEKLVQKNRGRPRFSFIDGPITANNPMGVHHAWGRTYKDLFQRYKAMLGFDQRFQNGFDGQGLWIEVEVEKELGFESKRDIEAYGVARFVEKCKERVLHFADVITQQSIRLGYWMDWSNSYHTMSPENNYTIWLFLKRCHERGLVYKGHDVMPWCPRCSTGISEHEIVTEGYQEISHKAVTVRFPIIGREREYLLAWTTTPWTLTSNVAAAVHPDLIYVRARQGDETYILAKNTLGVLEGPYQVVEEFPGQKLVGLKYRGPFDDLPAQQGVEHPVIPWEEVSEAEGTGVVHIAPGCGREDFRLGKQFGLPAIAPLDEFGNYVDGFAWLSGRSVGQVALPIIEDLERKGLLYKAEDYVHRYPVCWRCNSELVFRLVDEWFISMDQLRYDIMDVARRIRWIPEFGLDRELDWLRNMEDWMISKKRYWGLALPIWECANCGSFDVIGSEDELRSRAVQGWEEFEGHTPHRPWIDAVKIRCSRCRSIVSRIPDVGNPWLDAGIVPYSTLDYRHNRQYWEQWFPAEFITESFPGQYRNWFYSLLTMSTVMENREPFKTVLGYALLRDEKGEEMHKSKGNAIWFDEAAERVGADVLRWVFVRHNPAANLNFGWGVCSDATKRLLLLWNVYNFFVTYANIDQFDPTKHQMPVAERAEIDRWLVSRLQQLVGRVRQRLDDYDPAGASRPIDEFFDDLSTWYVRRSRRRFWKAGADRDKVAAFLTLHETLVTLSKLMAPFVPFLAEEIYQNLVRSVDKAAPESVHHCDFPEYMPDLVDEELLARMDVVRELVSLGRAARSQAGIRVRQPLPALRVKQTADLPRLSAELLDEIAEELNVKQVHLDPSIEDCLRKIPKARPEVLGPMYGAKTQEILSALRAGRYVIRPDDTVEVNGQVLDPAAVQVVTEAEPGYAIAQSNGRMVCLDLTITPELLAEGRAREVVHRVQTMRKEAGFDVEDRIITSFDAEPELEAAIAAHADYIRRETLSVELRKGADGGYTWTGKIDGLRVSLGVRKV